MRKRLGAKVLLYIPMVFFAIVSLMPVYVLLVTGMKSFAEIDLATMWALPKGVNFENFVAAYQKLAPNLLNSLYLVFPASILSAAVGSINGYILAKWKFRGANIIFPLILFGMFIPYQSVLIPLVIFMRTIGLYGSIPGLILIHVIYGIPITTLTFRNYFASVPTELVEAAQLDGATLLGIFRYVFFPLSLPAFVVVIIWEFTSIWNDYLFAVVQTNSSHWPITVALNNIAGSQIVQWNVQMAGALLAALPTLLVYIFLGRYFVRGLMAGALKGEA